MVTRYTRPEMGDLWTVENRFEQMRQVEIAVAQIQAGLKIIPRKAAEVIAKKAKFSIGRIEEIEKKTKHDVIAFVSNLAENVGPEGKFIHYGMTSSDILDTGLSLQIKQSAKILDQDFDRLEKSFAKLVRSHRETLVAGRTHGMFAEPTTFGLKMAGFLAEFRRHRLRVKTALEQAMIAKLSGAVGTYSSQSEEVETKVAKKLGLHVETIATQVIPRDRHAEMILSLAQLGSGIERIAIELRHLQRSEVGEVTEGFSAGQKGSSAMPHKKNPISAENLTGCARLLRSYAIPALENVALWHERDISHSAVERVIFPDAFILADYSLHRLAELLDGLNVNVKRMKEVVDLSQGQLFSSQVLLALVDKGLTREEAYENVQRLCHSLKPKQNLRSLILQDVTLKKHFNAKELNLIFSGKKARERVVKLTKRVVK